MQAAAPPDGRSLLSRLPLSFEENRGQTWDEVRFLARGPGYTAWVLPDRVVVRRVEHCPQIDRDAQGPRAVTGSSLVTLRFLGADPDAETSGRSRQPGTLRFYEGLR
ncbi:MAG: hypothetical protein JNK60_02870, partial [Acidobacteria bacterium]|nr:hypothetical protein [Acidobacteriota bacterium]